LLKKLPVATSNTEQLDQAVLISVPLRCRSFQLTSQLPATPAAQIQVTIRTMGEHADVTLRDDNSVAFFY
jgi:hypothetical protein